MQLAGGTNGEEVRDRIAQLFASLRMSSVEGRLA